MRFGLLLFITIPILEMYLLIQVGSRIGALPTIGLVVLTATIGLWLLRLEGLATLMRLQERVNQGEVPGRELMEGAMLLVGGALLLTPGFFTDAIGFVCLLPGLRKPIAEWLLNRGMIGAVGSFRMGRMGGAQDWSRQQPDFQAPDHDHKDHQNNRAGTTIDGEFEDQTPPPERPTIDRD